MAASGVDKALQLLRYLPRVALNNIKPNPKALKKAKPRRGQYGGDKCGRGDRRGKPMRIGYDCSTSPFYLKVPMEPYYRGHHLKRQYPPMSLSKLQLMIDLGRIDTSQPIDLATVCNTKLYKLSIDNYRHFGINLTDEGADKFCAKVNIEVQHASEQVIAAIERNGGVITTAYYDVASLHAISDPLRFFKRGVPIPKRGLPPEDVAEYYINPKNRGYLADPDEIAKERFALAQKYGYELPDISKDPMSQMLLMRKDPRQVFYGLQPGWVVNLTDKVILKPKDEKLEQFYTS